MNQESGREALCVREGHNTLVIKFLLDLDRETVNIVGFRQVNS